MPPLLISFCIGHLSRKEKRPFPNVSASCYSESEVLLCFEIIACSLGRMRLLLNSYIHETRGPKRHKFHYGQIKRSRHGPRCGHTPIDTVSYRPAWPWYINIEHVLHCENIIHIPTFFYYFAIPTPFFHFQCFFYLLD